VLRIVTYDRFLTHSLLVEVAKVCEPAVLTTMSQESQDAWLEERERVQEGILVYLFRGKKNPAERLVFVEMCKKYGLDWAKMEALCPWRARRNWCTSWKKITHIQAVGEFKTTNADPYQIRDAYHHMWKRGLQDDKYIYKNGMLVNKNPMLSMAQRNADRDANREKFSLTEEEAAAVQIPVVFPLEFLQARMAKRRAAMQAKIAAINWAGGQTRDLKIPSVTVIPGRLVVRPPRYATRLLYTTMTDAFIFDLDSAAVGDDLPFE
jgi:hypothetical protein